MNFPNKKHQELSEHQTVKVKIEKIEKDQVGLVTEDKQKIWWPRNKIPKGMLINEGTSFYLVLKTNMSDKKEQQELAKAILQEILNTNNHD